MKIGVLAVQGNFREHAAMLHGLGAEVVEVAMGEPRQPLSKEGGKGEPTVPPEEGGGSRGNHGFPRAYVRT